MNKKIDFFLTIDSGNSGSRFALFDKSGFILCKPSLSIEEIANQYDINTENTVAAFVSVTDNSAALDQFETYYASDYFTDNFFLDMRVSYSETLGLDRLVLAYYIFDTKSKYAVVDSGTFTTIDLIDEKGFCGGHILPGLRLLASTYDQGVQLKGLVKEPYQLNELPCPQSSEEAVSNGLSQIFLAPIKSILSTWEYEQLRITGGNGEILYNQLKNSDFQRSASIHFNDDLIHKALFKFLRRVTSSK